MEELSKINGIQVTNTYKSNDLIIISSDGELSNFLFVDGASTTIHRSHLLPIRIK